MSSSSILLRAEGEAGITVWRRIFSFPVMLASLLLLLSLLTVRSRFDDPDMWWHLKMGEVVWTTHSVPTTDIFSYTTNHHSWIPHEWLSQLTIYAAYHVAGYRGLMFWLCLFSTVLLLAGYLLCSLYSGNAKVAFAGALLIWLFATAGLAVRPQMIGYLLLICELIVLHLGRTRSHRWLWCLPPLFALWINCHGSFFLGWLMLAAVFVLSLKSTRMGALLSASWTSQQKRTLGLSACVSTAALFLNPVGLKQLLYPIDTLLKQPVSLSHVEEWLPLQLNSPRGIALLAVLGSFFLLALVRRAELYLHELVMLAAGTWLAVSHQRMVFAFGILAAPALTRLLSHDWDSYEIERDHPRLNAVVTAGVLLIAYVSFPTITDLEKQVEQRSPVKAVEYIKAQHLSGNMLNEYVFGGYLIWTSPEHPVFFDGRADVFDWTGVLSDFEQWGTLQRKPDTLLDKYDVGFCLLSRNSPMVEVLTLLHGWKRVYTDEISVVFVRS